jgi:ubiquinone/menaquinone biosynthesis C-methylase UbiE
MDPFEIKDRCRKNLTRYTLRAFSLIRVPAEPLILDIGCGSGVPTLALMGICPGRFVAVDPDPVSLKRLRRKVRALNCSARIELIQASIFALPTFPDKFDIILAEGSLHIVGFEAGMSIVYALLKNNGHALIHDQLHHDAEKRTFFKKIGLYLIDAFVLNEEIWRNEYYSCLERAILEAGVARLFAEETREINDNKKNPETFRSIYYILKKEETARQ